MKENGGMTQKQYQYLTRSARECFHSLQEWAQDARLYSEAIYRLKKDISGSKQPLIVSKDAWNLGKKDSYKLNAITVARVEQLRQKNWRSQFVLLEGIWEVYLEMLYVELSEKFPVALQEVCKQAPPEFLLSTLLSTDGASLEDVRRRTVEWLASNVTRKPWSDQWGELQRLGIGLNQKHRDESWWSKLDIYFEMRNCIIHRNGRPSELLRKKDPGISSQLDSDGSISLNPRQLQFFWIQFLNAITTIDKSLSGRLNQNA